MTSSTFAKSVKTKKIQTVEDYLAAVPEPARATLNKVRATIRSAVPKGTVEVISYGIPAFKLATPKSPKALIWYAAFAKHCSLFPTVSVIAKFKNELAGYKISKGTIQFPVDKPFPSALLKKMVKARLAGAEGNR